MKKIPYKTSVIYNIERLVPIEEETLWLTLINYKEFSLEKAEKVMKKEKEQCPEYPLRIVEKTSTFKVIKEI